MEPWESIGILGVTKRHPLRFSFRPKLWCDDPWPSITNPTSRTLLRRRLLLFFAAAIVACTSPAAPTGTGGVETLARNGQIEITNRTRAPIFTFVVGREGLALADWVPCVDAAKCQPLAPGAQRSAPYPIGEREALVNWWHAVMGLDGRLRPDRIHVAIVPLNE